MPTIGAATAWLYAPATVLVKLIFLTTFIMQVNLWPSAISILFISVYALGEMYSLVSLGGARWHALLKPGVFLVRGPVPTTMGYVYMGVMAIYFAAFFGLYIGHELDVQPASTFWLPPALVANFTARHEGLPVDVTSQTSRDMRDHAFLWPKHFEGAAMPLVGTIAGAGPSGGPLVCPVPGSVPSAAATPAPAAPASGGTTTTSTSTAGVTTTSAASAAYNASGNAAFGCAVKMLQVQPPSGYEGRPYVPLPDTMYMTDILVTPPAGVACKDMEVYRVSLDKDRNVVHGLDYPSSIAAAAGAGGGGAVHPPVCGLFGNANWCLQLGHTFTAAQYRAQLAERCNSNNGRQFYRLPVRAPDIDPETERIQPDVLVFTAGATIQMHAAWHGPTDGDGWWSPWRQVTHSDSVQPWRESSADVDLFFKYLASVTPLLIVWYYLAVEFAEQMPSNSEFGDVLFLCIFVLLPTILIYASIGAWLPMGGCIVCIFAVNHEVKSGRLYQRFVRPWLFFLTAACNSIQFVWLIALIAQAGYSAFYYEATLRQLYTLSDRFIITDTASPTWTALIIPSVLLLNAFFLLGSAICVVLEVMAYFRS